MGGVSDNDVRRVEPVRAPWVAALGLLALGCEGQVVAGSERRPGPRMENPDGATFVPPTEDAGVRADGDAGGNPVVGPSLGPAPGEVPVVAPSKTPERISGASGSSREVVMRL